MKLNFQFNHSVALKYFVEYRSVAAEPFSIMFLFFVVTRNRYHVISASEFSSILHPNVTFERPYVAFIGYCM